MAEFALEVDAVSVRLSGLQILDQVTIRARTGKVTGLIGPNGAGKTTVFNVVSGFIAPDAGTVRIAGQALHRHRAHQLTRLGVSRTLQGVGLFASLTAIENVMLGVPPRGRSGLISEGLAMPWTDRHAAATRALAREVMATLSIADDADRLPQELPYPVQKRIALARALVSDPHLILLDEPAGGIGAADIAELIELIRGWTPSRSVVLVEHHMDLVMSVCDELWVLDSGRVIASGTPEQVRTDAAVLAAYLGETAVG